MCQKITKKKFVLLILKTKIVQGQLDSFTQILLQMFLFYWSKLAKAILWDYKLQGLKRNVLNFDSKTDSYSYSTLSIQPYNARVYLELLCKALETCLIWKVEEQISAIIDFQSSNKTVISCSLIRSTFA